MINPIMKTRITRVLSNSTDNMLSLNTLKKVIGANVSSEVFESIIGEMKDEKIIESRESDSGIYIALIK